ncbi:MULTISPECIES: T9SS type A sorting domain-containing protein [Flavobacterium]|uniref:T9SS type A sorting domain-containing protein n=1 Tax=Flavobacterium TaxID=237 RepID=UPI001FCB50EE|nr:MULTISPECIES: T9SS type A sorting domain-containing protein [Flavobacterium]UOK43594.1 T9SS type A sorting domain-containing protein [Flavobacterium enshiense]
MKKHLLSLSILLSVICGYAQPSSWQKSLGGSDLDEVISIQQTTDGGYIMAGFTYSNDADVIGNHGEFDSWIVKLTNTGSIEWQKSLGGTGRDYACSIEQTTDGGYIIAGGSNLNDGDVTGNHGGNDCWIVKLSNTGSIQWQKSLGGTDYDYANSIQQTSDGGYIMAGYTGSNDGDFNGNHGSNDYWIVKLTNTGSIEWQKSLGGSYSDEARSIRQTTDGGYIIAGSSYSINGDVTGNHGQSDYWVVKLTNTGSIQWQKCLGGSGWDHANSIQQTTDGGYIIAGSTQSNNGDVNGNHGLSDSWIVKLSNSGSIQWQKCLGGIGDDDPYSIVQTPDGGYIIAGSTRSNDGDVTGNHGLSDYWIVKLTNTGSIQWQKCLGGTGVDYANSIQQTTDGGYIIAGYTESNDGNVTGNHGGSDAWIIKLLSDGTLSTNESSTENLISVYPNPANNEIHLNAKENTLGMRYTLYDHLGRAVMSGKLEEQDSTIVTSHLSKGVYILSIGDKIKTNRKIIKE